MYADDTKIFYPVDSKQSGEQLQQDLDNLVKWSHKWQLRFNAGKCKVLHLGRSNQEYTYCMKDHGSDKIENLESSEGEKDLGILVDHELKFSRHVETQVNKANKILGMVRRSYQYLDGETLRMLFTALIRPHLEFANVAWSPRYQKDKDLIEGVLRRASKMVPGLKNMCYEDRLKSMKLPSMEYRRQRGDMIETYKYMQGMYKVENIFELDDKCATRGHPYKIKKQRCLTNLRQHFFTCRVTNTWNSLPEEVVTAPNLQTFKNRLDKLWTERKYNVN